MWANRTGEPVQLYTLNYRVYILQGAVGTKFLCKFFVFVVQIIAKWETLALKKSEKVSQE